MVYVLPGTAPTAELFGFAPAGSGHAARVRRGCASLGSGPQPAHEILRIGIAAARGASSR